MYKDQYPRFAISGIYEALVVDVYDGDTITCVFDPFPGSDRSYVGYHKVRMLGIDTPEIRISNSNPETKRKLKAIGISARDYLREMILNKHVILYIPPDSDEKFGRLLAYVYVEDGVIGGYENSINEKLVVAGHAVPYEGGKKYDWTLSINTDEV